MGTKNNPAPYDCYAHAHPDEPMFVLLGRDKFGASLVRLWALAREMDDENEVKVQEARDCADAMADWCSKTTRNSSRFVLAWLPFDMLADELRRRGATVQPELIDHARQLLKNAESYRHLRDRSKTRLRVWLPQEDGGATGPFDLGHLDAEIAAVLGCTPAVG